jgi:hypothetical protein
LFNKKIGELIFYGLNWRIINTLKFKGIKWNQRKLLIQPNMIKICKNL